jgi:hypothetical protein
MYMEKFDKNALQRPASVILCPVKMVSVASPLRSAPQPWDSASLL